MKKRQLYMVTILMLPLVLELFSGCCDCGDVDRIDFSYCEFELAILDTSEEYPIRSTVDSLSKMAFGIQVDATTSQSTCMAKPTVSFFSQAQAYSCDCIYDYVPREKINSMSVYSLTDFNEDLPAGSDVSTAFRIYNYQEELPLNLSSLEKIGFLGGKNEGMNTEAALLLRIVPEAGTYNFEVRIALADGSMIIQETGPVVLY